MKKQKKSKQIFNYFFIKCPVCGRKGFSVRQVLNDIPYFGEVLETFANCKFCGYKTYDILPLGEKKYPKVQEITVHGKKELSLRVVKGKYCSIEIPEIGLKIKPGPNSEAYISNVEGVIDRIIEAFEKISVVKKEKEKEVKSKIKKIKSAKMGKEKIKIKFIDPTGQSAIIRKS